MVLQIQLDKKSGAPFYRQIINLVKSGIATGRLEPGDQLPTVRQLGVDLAINPNTVSRAYMELELTGLVTTQMGLGTFVSTAKVERGAAERQRLLDELCHQLLAQAAAHGLTLDDLIENLERHKNR